MTKSAKDIDVPTKTIDELLAEGKKWFSVTSTSKYASKADWDESLADFITKAYKTGQKDILKRVEKEVIDKQHPIFVKDNIVSLVKLEPYKRGREVLRKEQRLSLEEIKKEI